LNKETSSPCLFFAPSKRSTKEPATPFVKCFYNIDHPVFKHG
jgi:hypothetical protein